MESEHKETIWAIGMVCTAIVMSLMIFASCYHNADEERVKAYTACISAAAHIESCDALKNNTERIGQ